MKTLKLIVFGIVAMMAGTGSVYADSLKDLFGNKGLGDLVNVVTGNGDIQLNSLEGTWKATGPAVVLRSGDALEQAGGSAVASLAENKLMPYYEKLGLEGSTVTFDASGNYTMTVKGKTIKGRLIKNDDGTFTLSLTQNEKLKLGKLNSFTTYVQKTSNTLALTVDVKKLLEVLKLVANTADLETINTAIKLLESYDNVCLGLRFSK